MVLLAALFLLLPAAVAVEGQLREPLGEVRIRVLTRQAEAEAAGDSTTLVLTLDQYVREAWGEFESFPISIVRREDLIVSLTTPYMGYRRAVAEHLRMRRPLEEVPWPDAAVIAVSPERLEAPDIRSVVVTRDGREIPPLENRLRPMTFTSGTGAKAVIHAGELRYPMTAFAPGATVLITAVPATGDPIAYPITEAQLQALK